VVALPPKVQAPPASAPKGKKLGSLLRSYNVKSSSQIVLIVVVPE